MATQGACRLSHSWDRPGKWGTHSPAPLTLMASPRLPKPHPCSPCQQLLETQQPKLVFISTRCTWCIGTNPVPLLSAGNSCPCSNGERPANTGMGPHVPLLPQMGAQQGAAFRHCVSRVLTSSVCPCKQAAGRKAGNSVARAGSLRADVIFNSQLLSHFCQAATGSAVC